MLHALVSPQRSTHTLGSASGSTQLLSVKGSLSPHCMRIALSLAVVHTSFPSSYLLPHSNHQRKSKGGAYHPFASTKVSMAYGKVPTRGSCDPIQNLEHSKGCNKKRATFSFSPLFPAQPSINFLCSSALPRTFFNCKPKPRIPRGEDEGDQVQRRGTAPVFPQLIALA